MPDQFDIDAIILLEKALRASPGPTGPQERVAKLVAILRETDIHVTSVNAVSLDSEEQEAMDHLIAVRRQIFEWYRSANVVEHTAAINQLQGFIIQHMLHRLNPEAWADWTYKPSGETTKPL